MVVGSRLDDPLRPGEAASVAPTRAPTLVGGRSEASAATAPVPVAFAPMAPTAAPAAAMAPVATMPRVGACASRRAAPAPKPLGRRARPVARMYLRDRGPAAALAAAARPAPAARFPSRVRAVPPPQRLSWRWPCYRRRTAPGGWYRSQPHAPRSQVLLGARFVISRKRGYFAPLEMGDDSTNAKAPLLTTSAGEVAPSQGARARPPRDFAL